MPGEIADMMLDGTLCASCGVPLFDSAGSADGVVPWGFPNYCSPQCARDQGATHWKGGLLCEPRSGTGRIPKREEEMMNDYEKLCARAFTSSLNYVRKSGGAALSEEHGHAIVMSLAREMRSWCNNNGGLALGPVMDAIIA